jgi:hypothetical protein
MKDEDYDSELEGFDDSQQASPDPSDNSGPPMNFKDVGYDSEVNMSEGSAGSKSSCNSG